MKNTSRWLCILGLLALLGLLGCGGSGSSADRDASRVSDEELEQARKARAEASKREEEEARAAKAKAEQEKRAKQAELAKKKAEAVSREEEDEPPMRRAVQQYPSDFAQWKKEEFLRARSAKVPQLAAAIEYLSSKHADKAESEQLLLDMQVPRRAVTDPLRAIASEGSRD